MSNGDIMLVDTYLNFIQESAIDPAEKDYLEKIGNKMVPLLKTVTAIGIIFSAYTIYKNFLSHAARMCRGSDDKDKCMHQFKIKALKTEIDFLKSRAKECSKSKTPERCHNSISQKVKDLENKLKKSLG
jgi:hypothetical protein